MGSTWGGDVRQDNGELHLWGIDEKVELLADVPAGPFTTVALSIEHDASAACAVRTDGEALCWGPAADDGVAVDLDAYSWSWLCLPRFEDGGLLPMAGLTTDEVLIGGSAEGGEVVVGEVNGAECANASVKYIDNGIVMVHTLVLPEAGVYAAEEFWDPPYSEVIFRLRELRAPGGGWLALSLSGTARTCLCLTGRS